MAKYGAMKLLRPCVIFALVVFAAAGCGKKKEITSLDRKQAANLVAEAQFAVSIRDYARAEGLLGQAAALCPDTGSYWLVLGSTRVRLGKRGDARRAYQEALGAFEDAAAKDKNDAQAALQQVYVLALLGRQDDARKLLAKLPDRYPNDRNVRAFVEGRLDRIVSDPQFKEIAL